MIDYPKLQFLSGQQIDKVIGVFTGSIYVGAPTSTQGWLSVTQTQQHGFGDSAYFQGIFTTDGVTWNDFGCQTPYLGGAYPTFQTCECEVTVDSSGVNVTATSWYDNGNQRSQAYNVTYKVFLIAKNKMAHPIQPIPVSNPFSLLSEYNYQKIAVQGTQAVNVAGLGTATYTIPHNLGYIPKVRAWWFDSSTPTVCQSIIPPDTDISFAPVQIKVDTSNVYFYFDSGNFYSSTIGNIEYRIYYD